MKIQVAAAAAALMAAAAFCGPVSAQNPAGANAKQYGIAVVDISYIFKNHQRFTSAMDGMKTEIQSVETDVKSKQQQIVKAQEQQKNYNPGTPEFKKLDEQIIRMNAALQVDVTQKRKDLVEREAQIYYNTYLEVSNAIEQYAKHYEIGLVLRFNGEDADPANRESILRNINKAVHFQNQVDITPDILAMLNRQSTAQAGGGTSQH